MGRLKPTNLTTKELNDLIVTRVITNCFVARLEERGSTQHVKSPLILPQMVWNNNNISRTVRPCHSVL